jgi:hypothetical protein
MIKGVYSASLSVINANGTLNIEATIAYANDAIKKVYTAFSFLAQQAKANLYQPQKKKNLYPR